MTSTAKDSATTGELGGVNPKMYERRWLILGVLCLSLVLVVAAVSSVNVAIPSIRQQLRPTDSQLLWIVDLYAVVFAGLLLPAGALGDKFGRRGALQIGLVIFGLGSVLSSQADSPAQLLAFRAVMGIGAAFIMPSTLSLLTSVFPPNERSRAIAVWTGFAGAGGVIGTLAGGVVLNSFWWGSVFFVSVPIALLALVLVTVLCPSSKEEVSRRLDPVGALLSVSGFGGLLYGIIEGPEKGWGSVHSIGAFAVAAVALGGFVVWEGRTRDPMLDVNYFRMRRFGIRVPLDVRHVLSGRAVLAIGSRVFAVAGRRGHTAVRCHDDRVVTSRPSAWDEVWCQARRQSWLRDRAARPRSAVADFANHAISVCRCGTGAHGRRACTRHSYAVEWHRAVPSYRQSRGGFSCQRHHSRGRRRDWHRGARLDLERALSARNGVGDFCASS
jgi:MFS family permease